MEAITLTRKDYKEGLDQVDKAAGDSTYLDQFSVTFPDGINTASTLELCRVMQNPSMENKVRVMCLCIRGKNVEVRCPNGDVEKFCMNGENDNFEAFPLFVREPLAVIAISDAIYGFLLKKYVRLSKDLGAAATTE